MIQLDGKVAIITGASSGIGSAAARLFAAEGAHLVLGARRQPELTALVAEIKAAGGSPLRWRATFVMMTSTEASWARR